MTGELEEKIHVKLDKNQLIDLVDSINNDIISDMVKTPKIKKKKINLSDSTLFEQEETMSINKAGKAKMQACDEPQFDIVEESEQVRDYPLDLITPEPGPSRQDRFVTRAQKIGAAAKKSTQELLGYDTDSSISESNFDHSSYGSTFEKRVRRGDPSLDLIMEENFILKTTTGLIADVAQAKAIRAVLLEPRSARYAQNISNVEWLIENRAKLEQFRIARISKNKAYRWEFILDDDLYEIEFYEMDCYLKVAFVMD